MLKGNAVIGQSGGPTMVINQSLVGVIQQAQKSACIQRLLGARHGVRGMINNDYIDLKGTPNELLERIAYTPSAALGSTRDKPDQAYCERIFDNFKKNDVRFFFYIGGNDSADSARIIHEMALAANYDLQVYHVPKTIDNDLRVHDHTPGFGSAAKFVTMAMIGDDYDNKSLPGIKIDVIMGRNAGFLTAASVLARKYENDGPHLIYVPEAPLSELQFLADVDRVYSKLGRCLIAVSEGVSLPEKDGKGKQLTWADKILKDQEVDSHGNKQLSGTGALGDYMANLVTTRLPNPSKKKLRVRADTFGYLQRSFPFVSEVDAREGRLVGEMAVKYADDPSVTQGSVAMRRVSNSPYKIEIHLTPLATVARETKHLDPSFIKDGNDITDAFKEYVRPLVGELPNIGSFAELK